MKVSEILWLSQTEYPLVFEQEQPLFDLTGDKRSSKIIVFGLLKEGKWCYKGITLVFCQLTRKTLTGNIVETHWIDLRTFIENFGEYILK